MFVTNVIRNLCTKKLYFNIYIKIQLIVEVTVGGVQIVEHNIIIKIMPKN